MVSEVDLEKLKLIDQVFEGLTLDDVKSLLSSDLIVGKLRGHDNSTGPILGAFQELSILQVDVALLRGEFNTLKTDFMLSLRALNTLSMPAPPMYSQDLQVLKQKYGVY